MKRDQQDVGNLIEQFERFQIFEMTDFSSGELVHLTTGDVAPALADPRGAGRGHALPLAAWASTQNALKVAIFKLKIEKFSGEGAMPSPQTPVSFPLHKSNHNVVSNTLVLSPRAICIHTTASFPTSNGFLRLKRFKQSMEE